MAWFDDNLRFPGRYFTAEICDICIVWYYPAIFINGDAVDYQHLSFHGSNINGDAVLDIQHLREMVRANRALVNERSQGSELWFLGQAHSQPENMVRMPTPEEMETIFKVATQEGVDGFLWYTWLHDQYDRVLSDPGMEPQREAVRTIYETYISSAP